ncbi:MAG TPA: carboxypeptidase-like regulatory domain-containing protein [Polyangiaceae bacterium]|nr:carboxypeptidase-like regulatory domain-containing protein [Polyangiaceae bacterium]
MRGRLAILILVALPACMNTSRLHGRVIDCQTQSPVEGADVQLTSPASGASWSAVQTAGDGSFAFDVPREAKGSALTLTAVKSGYRSSQTTYPSLPGAAQEVCVAPTLR